MFAWDVNTTVVDGNFMTLSVPVEVFCVGILKLTCKIMFSTVVPTYLLTKPTLPTLNFFICCLCGVPKRVGGKFLT